MTPKAGYRGQPVFMLVVLLGGWVAVRAATWEPVQFAGRVLRVRTPAQGMPDSPPRHPRLLTVTTAEPAPLDVAEPSPAKLHDQPRPATHSFQRLLPEPTFGRVSADVVPAGPPDGLVVAEQSPSEPDARTLTTTVSAPAELSFEDISPAVPASELASTDDAIPIAAPAAPIVPGELARERSVVSRWSGDGWLLLRKDTTTAVTSGRGSYGQSQLGAVLRYSLVPRSKFRPAAFVRASQALAGAEESEVAAGLSARPVPFVPLVAAAEMRATRVKDELEWRPAVYVYTQLPPAALPLDVTGEAYLQAGYVGGDFATAFVDGQVRADRPVVTLGTARVNVGAGAWGGAQKGAERLDIGPSALVQAQLGGVPARLSLDWRFRVAGDAEPSSGPALTISAGF